MLRSFALNFSAFCIKIDLLTSGILFSTSPVFVSKVVLVSNLLTSVVVFFNF